MIKTIHPIAGVTAFLTIAIFWASTVLVELFGSEAAVAQVKTAIPWGLLVLVPAMAAVGGTGFKRAGGRRGGVIGAKVKRMPIIAANGVILLIPSAFFLAFKARAGEFDAVFYSVQLIELTAGAANLFLMSRSMRDGFRLTGRFRRRA